MVKKLRNRGILIKMIIGASLLPISAIVAACIPEGAFYGFHFKNEYKITRPQYDNLESVAALNDVFKLLEELKSFGLGQYPNGYPRERENFYKIYQLKNNIWFENNELIFTLIHLQGKEEQTFKAKIILVIE